MSKRSNPTRNVPHPAPFGGGGVDGMRNRTDFAGASRRANDAKARNSAHRPNARDLAAGKRTPVDAVEPKPPPLLVLLPDENYAEFGPAPIYGQYPRGLITKLLPWLRCKRSEVLHVCSGCLPKGEGIRVDIRPEARPDVLADGRKLPFADGSQAAVMVDPPYCPEYAASLYGIEYPLPKHLLVEATRVVRPSGRIVFVHYITPKPVPGMTFVKSFGLSIGFDMPMRAVSIYERNQSELAL